MNSWSIATILTVILALSASQEQPQNSELSAPSAPSEEDDSEIVSAPEGLPPSAPGPLEECDPDMIGFELVTGFVFSAPTNVLDSIPGTLMLSDCLETCQGNDSCQSVNYETGLCVLFSSNADVLPGKLFFESIQKHNYSTSFY